MRQTFSHRKSLIEELSRFNSPKLLCKMLDADKIYLDSIHSNDNVDQRKDFIFLIGWMLQRKMLLRMHKYIKYIGGKHKGTKKHKDDKLNAVFAKAKPFLNGRNHEMEIMFLTGLTLKKLQQIVDEYGDELLTFHHTREVT